MFNGLLTGVLRVCAGCKPRVSVYGCVAVVVRMSVSAGGRDRLDSLCECV